MFMKLTCMINECWEKEYVMLNTKTYCNYLYFLYLFLFINKSCFILKENTYTCIICIKFSKNLRNESSLLIEFYFNNF